MSDRAAAFLAQLEAADFLPPEAAVAAWNREAARPLPLSRGARRDLADEAEPEIAKFLAAFWSLDPAERRARWEAFRAWHPDGRHAARLAALEPALLLPAAPDFADSFVKELAALFRELALLAPPERTARRHEWLGRAGDRKEWGNAIHVLRRLEPKVPTLDPILTEWIARFPNLPAMVEAEPHVASASQSEPLLEEAYQARRWWELIERNESAKRRGPLGTIEKVGTRAIYGTVAAVILLMVFIAVTREGNRANPKVDGGNNSYTRPPSWTPGTTTFPNGTHTYRPDFSTAELLAFYEYRLKPVGPVPPRYAMFMLLDGEKVLNDLQNSPARLALLRGVNEPRTPPTRMSRPRPTTP